jgi:uncharacterized membrane protein
LEFDSVMENTARVFEVVGVTIIAAGGLYGLIRAALPSGGRDGFFEEARRGFGHPLLLGLEVLVAADIIQTVTIDPSLENVASLGILVLIRVVLSFALDAEVDGVAPWRRAEVESRSTPRGSDS